MALLLALAGTAAIHAADSAPAVSPGLPDTSRWLCSLCPFRQGFFGTLDFGPGYVNGSSLKYADYRGLDDRGAFPALGGDLHYRDAQDHYVDIYARHLGIASRSIEVRGGLRGRYQLRLAYQEIPRYRGYGTATVYSGSGTGSLTLPENWQKSPSTAGMTALDSSLAPASLETLRRTLEGGLTWKFARNWSADVDAQHVTRDGTRPFGAGLFTINTSQFPAPVDFTTDQFDLGLQYSTANAHLRFGFAGSWFDNGTTSITWENPFSSAPGNQLLRAALAPDNEYYRFSLQGAYAPRPGLRLSGRASIGRMSQNDPYLPYSINPDFDDLILPRSSADTRIDTGTLNIAGALYARLASRLDVSASVKIDQRDNQSPVDAYSIVITDFVPGGDRFNRPYSFERQKYEVALSYRAAPAATFRAGARQEDYQRTLQSVLDTDERLYWGEVNFNQWSAGQLRVKLETSAREASPWQPVDDTGLIENPLMRKFHYADRDSDRAIVELDLSPGEIWSINLSWSQAQADYSASVVGLQHSDEESFSVDIGVSPAPGISLNAYASRDDISSALSGLESATQTPWQGFTDDRTTTLGLGISGRVSKTASWGLDWMHSNSSGKIAVISNPADQPFPVLHNHFGNLRGYVTFAVNRSWAVKVLAEYESLSTTDWQIDGLGPAGLSNVLTLGDISPRYYITSVRLQASYRF